MIIKVILLSVVVVAIALLIMAVGTLVRRNGRFPGLHIGKNKEMGKRGITCATTQDREARAKGRAF